MFHLKLNPGIALAAILMALPSVTSAQVVNSYQLVPQTIYEKKPVTVSRWIDETVMEKQQVTSYKPVWEKEARERRIVSYKPVQQTREREQRIVTYKPVVETLFRENRIEETTYETVTEYRDEQTIVRRPVVETQMREENYTVRKPVTENLIEVQRVTTYKPVLKPQTQMVEVPSAMNSTFAVPDNSQRSRLMRLDGGYYTDATTGATVYRARGLHWVQPTVAVPATTLVPQQTNQVEFIPETVETRKPVEVTRYVDTVVTRKVPVDVERIVEQVETRKVPVTVCKPITNVRIEKIPYTKTTYKEEVVLKKVPYVETTYQKVETVEPYEIEVLKWLPETKEVGVPRTVRRRVDYEIMQDVPRTVLMKLPVDACGNPIANAVPIYESTIVPPSATSTVQKAPAAELSTGYGSTLTRRVEPTPGANGYVPPANSVVNNAAEAAATEPPKSYKGTTELVKPKATAETSDREKSVLEPEPIPGNESDLQKLERPDADEGIRKTPVETTDRTEKGNAESTDAGNDAGNDDATQPNNGGVPKVEMPDDAPTHSGDEQAADRIAALVPRR